MELEPGTEIAGYRIESVVGRGGMGVVYLAEQRSLNRRVALKLVAPELAADEGFRARFVREAQLAASLEHPNIIPIHDAGEADGVLFISMRYIPGVDLDRRLDEGGALPPAETLDVMRQAGGALDAAHEAGLVHRDVKPANILIASGAGASPEGRVFLTDFGLTKRMDSRSRLTRTGFFLGTVAYAAPEQLQGRDVDGRVDVYSLTCVLYHCLTGRLPFERDTDPALVAAHLMDPPPRPTLARPDLPAAMDDVVDAGMAKSPDDRYPTCRAMIDDLRSALAGGGPIETTFAAAPAVPGGGTIGPPSPGPPPPPPPLTLPPRQPATAGSAPETPVPPTASNQPASGPGRPRPAVGSAVIAIVGAALVLGAGLLALVLPDGLSHVVLPTTPFQALCFTAVGVLAMVGAGLARGDDPLGWGLTGGTGLSMTLLIVADLSVYAIFRAQVVDDLAALIGGALCFGAMLSARRRVARPRDRRSLLVVAIAAIGTFGLVAPVIHSALIGASGFARFDVVLSAGCLAGALVALFWKGAEGAGMTIGTGTTVTAVYLVVLGTPDALGGLTAVVPALVGGVLTVVAGLLEVVGGRRRAARRAALPQWGTESTS